MCTTVVSIDPHSDVPVLLAGVRDEFLERPWLPPGWHWPEHPALVGGQDLETGGTWLAVQTRPHALGVTCVLNAHGDAAPEAGRRTRGELPLRLAADGRLGELEPERYDPFHLVYATVDSTRLWSWNGRALTERTLGPGLHIVVNSGLEGADDHDGPGDAEMQARIDYFRPLLEKAPRPEPRAGAVESAWGAWLGLIGGADLDPADPRALVVRHTVEDRRWGTNSLSLVALTRGSVRYDFCPNPADPRPTWTNVLTP